MNAETPPKIYIVKSYDITLKSGINATFNLREDLGDFLNEQDTQWVFHVPREKTVSTIMRSEIAAWRYQTIEMKELPVYVPKSKRQHGKGITPGEAGRTDTDTTSTSTE